MDHRFPRCAERRHRERLRFARQDGTSLPPDRSRTASSTSCTKPASGCAMSMVNRHKAFLHICWDGCMFPNAVMRDPKTWRDILSAMIAVRNAHGWEWLLKRWQQEPLNIGLVGYGFMGRTHSNAFLQGPALLRPSLPPGVEGGLCAKPGQRPTRLPRTGVTNPSKQTGESWLRGRTST